MYCSDETLKDHTNASVSRSEKGLIKTTSLQTEQSGKLKPTPQEEPVDIQQDCVLSDDSLIFAKSITEESSVKSKSVISNLEVQQLFSPSEKPHERKTDSCKISLPDSITIYQSQDMENHETQNLYSNSLLSERTPEKSSLVWSEEKGVEEPPFERASKKTVTKDNKEFTVPTPLTQIADTDITLTEDQHLSVEPSQNRSHNPFLDKNQRETSLRLKANAKGNNDTKSSDSSKKIIIGSHEGVLLSVPTTVTETSDIYLNQSQSVPDQTQTQQSLKFSTNVSTIAAESTKKPMTCVEESDFSISTAYNERTSLPKSTNVPVLTECINPDLAKAKLEAKVEDTTKCSNESFMKLITLKKKDELENVSTKKSIAKTPSFDDNKYDSHEDSLEAQQNEELLSNILPFEFTSERVTKAVVKDVDVQQKSISSTKPNKGITGTSQITFPSSIVCTQDQDTLLTKEQDQTLPIVCQETPSIDINIQKQSYRSTENIAVETPEDASSPNIIAPSDVPGMLLAQDQTQMVAKQNQCQQHDVLVSDVKGKKKTLFAHTIKSSTFSAESIAIKSVLNKTVQPIKSICATYKKLAPLPTSPDALVEKENTKYQMIEPQVEAGGMDSTKIISKTSGLKPYTLNKSGEFRSASLDDNVMKTSLQMQAIIVEKNILHKYPLDYQNLLSNVTPFELTPERTSLTSVELHQQSIVSDKPNVSLSHSSESHTDVTNILLARGQSQSLEAQQDEKSPSNVINFQTPLEKSVKWPPSVVSSSDLNLPLTDTSMSSETIAPDTHEDITLSNTSALTHVPDIPLAREQTNLITEEEQNKNKQHGCLISDVNVDQVLEPSTPLENSSKNDISSHGKSSSLDPGMISKNKGVYLSRNINQEQAQTPGLVFSTSSIYRQTLLAKGADVPVQREGTTPSSVEEAQVLEQILLERSGVVLESSELTKKPSLQTQWFDYHKHTDCDYPLNNERDQQLPNNTPVPKLTDKISSGTWSESVVVGVDAQQKSASSGKPSENNEGSFEITSSDLTVHTTCTGITLTKSDLSDAEFQKPSMSSQKQSESNIDTMPPTAVTDSTRAQAHIPLEDKQLHVPSTDTFVFKTMHDGSLIMGSKSDEIQQTSALFKRSSSDSTLTQNQKENIQFAVLHQDSQTTYPYPSVTLYPGTSPDYPEISDTSSMPLHSTHTVLCMVESPTMLLTSSSGEEEETAVEESFLSQSQCVTQNLNSLNVETHEVARFVCYINPQTLSSAVWYHNHKKLAATERIKFKQIGNILLLLIYDIHPEDKGIYSCVVKYKDGKTQTTSAELNIEGGYTSCNHLIPNHQITCCVSLP